MLYEVITQLNQTSPRLRPTSSQGAGKQTTVDIVGNEKSGKVIIFSHGFGVDRTSKGKFTEFTNALKEDYLCITFDYNQFDSEGSYNFV